MFGKKKEKATPLMLSQERFDTLIGRDTEIHGKLVIHESVRIDGKVIGNIESRKDTSTTVVVGASSQIQGDILAHRVVVAGQVAGHIHAHERVELHTDCLVQGDIKYGSIAIEHGARVLGLLLQVDPSEAVTSLDQGAQNAIRKAQSAS